jgi:hypothetical protein
LLAGWKIKGLSSIPKTSPDSIVSGVVIFPFQKKEISACGKIGDVVDKHK